MPAILTGLVNQLDASVLLLSGFSNGQSLLNATVPDQVDPLGWSGTCYSLYVAGSASPVGTPAIRFESGNLIQNNYTQFLAYTEMTVMICAKRTALARTGQWMGLYSMMYNGGWGKLLPNQGGPTYSNGGMSLLALTDENHNHDYTKWGTYGNINSYQSTSAMDIGLPMVVSIVAGPDTSCTFYTNASASGGPTFASKAQAYRGLGGSEPSDRFFIGDVYEVLVYNRGLSASEIATNATYLRGKWFP
jgi:hypothetical protein